MPLSDLVRELLAYERGELYPVCTITPIKSEGYMRTIIDRQWLSRDDKIRAVNSCRLMVWKARRGMLAIQEERAKRED